MDIPVNLSRATGQAPLGMPQGSPTMRLAQLGLMLRRHAWLIGLCAGVGAVGAAAFAMTMPNVYTANGAVTVEGERLAIPELQGVLRGQNAPDPMPYVRTEVQALSSRERIQAAADALKLEQNPEFNAALRPPGISQLVKDEIKSWLPARSAGGPAAGPDDAVLNAATRALAVTQDNRSLVIGVSFTAQDPAVASRFINTLIDGYIDARAKRNSSANLGANTAINQRIEELRREIAGFEQQMRELRASSDLVNLRAGSVGQQKLEELATASARATLARSELEANVTRARALAAQGATDALANVLNSPTVSRLREQEATASRRVAELSARYGSGYPAVRSAGAEVASARRQLADETGRIISSLDSQLRVARENEADVQKQLATAQRGGITADNARARLEQMQQELTSRRTLYQTLLERSQQTIAQPTGTAGNETPDVRVLSMAVPPSNPSGPNVKLAGAMGGVGGIILGCLLALTRIASVDGFRSTGDVSQATGLLVVGTLPPFRRRHGAMKLPDGVEADAVRSLRARLRSSARTGTPRSVVLTAVSPTDDAARMAVALACTAAADGERVLLLEGNLAAPSLGTLLGVANSGLVGVLEGRADWRDALASDSTSPLDLLLAGQRMPDSHRLLSGVGLQNLLVEARDDYDLVVIDAPPADSAEAGSLARLADVTVVVIDAAARRQPTREAAARLAMASRNPPVAVLLASS
jgi:succinoglycan biosynthesis transport protein ExoP